jgi:KaiC domain protein
MGGEADPDPTGEDVFETDFGSAFENAPSVEGVASDSFPDADADKMFGNDPADFDESTFESDLERVDVGIEGLDEMILGGVPERSMMVAIGAAGTGKTTFGLQFLEQALSDDGRAVYITLEESRERILDTATEKGWPFREYVADDRLTVVDLDPVEMANSLASIRNELPRLIEEFGADRLVLDSVSLLEMMYDHPAKRRSEVFDFARSLKQAGVTTMLTSEASSDSPYTSRYGIVEYLADAVFVLQYIRHSEFRETRLGVEIQKIRDANHSRETKPYEITDEGISVYRQANIF